MRLSLKSFALAPWSALRVLSSDKSFIDNPVLGSRRLNRHGLHVWRVRAAHAATWRRRAALAAQVEPADLAAFARDGFVLRRDVLPRDTFERLRDQVLSQQAPAREMVQGDTVTRRITVDRDLRRRVPALEALVENTLWRGLTRYIAGYDQPPWVYLQTILTHTRDAPPDPQTRLHSDTFHPTMKAWYFLTDVELDDGPFCYVPGSHRLTPERLAWEQAMSLQAASLEDRHSARGSFRIDAGALASVALPPPCRIAVPANTLIVADTYGFHARGLSLRPSMRIEVWGYDRRNPFMPWTTDGVLALLGLLDKRAPVYWRALDALERLTGKRNPWRDAGRLAPDAPATAAALSTR
jgi:hypothetical protein